uniref:tRNA threonylcarbamoyladenosine biosynthesis protein TsaE n=1 Tax=Paulinella chromatophora TaxID=39717 RepID=B1X4M2_PAUCH|nr:hypothetical protein PCC_0452 [Paulinella chromatophora]ACB42891.1 hypothetical protein PCC_0452 [Paulinella chromatophora]
MEHLLTDSDSTHRLGNELAQPLIMNIKKAKHYFIPSILMLHGNLGAGKTCITQGLAKGIGISEPITSPTFTLVQHYQGKRLGDRIKLVHIDLYRLDQKHLADELFEQEKDEANTIQTIIVIEWPERLSFVPKDSWNIELTIESKGRRVLIIPPMIKASAR